MVTAILSKYNPGDRVNNKIINELVKHHPTKKIENVEYLFLQRRPPFNDISLYYKSRNSEAVDDISYVLCIKNLFGKFKKSKQYKDDVMTAFRTEIRNGTRKDFYMSHTTNENGCCKHCGIFTTGIAVDHYPITYKEIFDIFVKERNLIIDNINIFENERNLLLLKNEDLSKDWIHYHDKVANYRLLCHSCNSKLGSYGYKSI
tara:strand:+ start:489 stop:1097 length:609 start_codon:yes stop_codon:yes gene_type:complete